MRSSLFGAGVLVALMGLILYFTIYLYLGIPLAAGGGVMVLASLLLPEGPAPLAPPEGYKFCVFCSSPVPADDDRCPHCNGYQPRLR